MPDEAEVAEQAELEREKEAAKKARDRAYAAMWSLEVVVLAFAILIVVIILLFQQIQVEIVASVAIAGLAVVWFLGRRRGRQLYKSFFGEEVTRLEQEQKKAEEEETIEDKVRKALQDKWR
jgi:lipopolysaccharide export LptBFGC system permease protein LptF